MLSASSKWCENFTICLWCKSRCSSISLMIWKSHQKDYNLQVQNQHPAQGDYFTYSQPAQASVTYLLTLMWFSHSGVRDNFHCIHCVAWEVNRFIASCKSPLPIKKQKLPMYAAELPIFPWRTSKWLESTFQRHPHYSEYNIHNILNIRL